MLRSLSDISKVKPGNIYPLWSHGDYSLHDLLPILVNLTGPANICLASYTISEEGIRAIHNLANKNELLSVNMILDNSVLNHKLDLLQFAAKIPRTSVFLGSTHAKMILLSNNMWRLSYVTSANITPNKRSEAGIVSTLPYISDDFIKGFNMLTSLYKEFKVK